jgi:hypothetical protein
LNPGRNPAGLGTDVAMPLPENPGFVPPPNMPVILPPNGRLPVIRRIVEVEAQPIAPMVIPPPLKK